jgi:hypothetical protein
MEAQIVEFPIDHIRPRTVGGQTSQENLALACPRCNGHKWAFETGLDPQSGIGHRLFNPRIDDWRTHFAWAEDGTARIQGKTEIGRATVERLRMNDAEVLAIRRLLLQLGIAVIERF